MVSGLLVDQLNRFENHPFKEGIKDIISKHCSPAIADRFSFVLEVEQFNKGNKAIANQLKDEVYICEVYYTSPSGLAQYICDVFSKWSKEETELHLLRYISDKVKSGLIGNDWTNELGKISVDIASGKHLTEVPVEL